jgi:hypothetical protein
MEEKKRNEFGQIPDDHTKNDTYYLHQTPNDLARDLINLLPLKPGDTILEPFKGEGAFYDNFPADCHKDWCEITEGRDYKTHQGTADWVISNPPFRMEDSNGKRVNCFFQLLEYYSTRANKGIAFLGNDYCFSTLTPIRMKKLNELGWYLQGYTICNVKKWRGRYFFMVFTKEQTDIIKYLLGSY